MTQERGVTFDLVWEIFKLLFVLFVVGIFVLSFCWSIYDSSKPKVSLEYTGQIVQPFLGTPRFVVTVFHQHPGNLRNGQLKVMVSGSAALGSRGRNEQIHSYEIWEPNQDHAVVMEFPLRDATMQQALTVTISLKGAGIHSVLFEDVWTSRGWQSSDEINH